MKKVRETAARCLSPRRPNCQEGRREGGEWLPGFSSWAGRRQDAPFFLTAPRILRGSAWLGGWERLEAQQPGRGSPQGLAAPQRPADSVRKPTHQPPCTLCGAPTWPTGAAQCSVHCTHVPPPIHSQPPTQADGECKPLRTASEHVRKAGPKHATLSISGRHRGKESGGSRHLAPFGGLRAS